MERKNFYFTFGDDRTDKYVLIEAENMAKARERMFLECGKRWAFCYEEGVFLEIQEKYNLKLLYHFICD